MILSRFLQDYIKLAPLQLALVRSFEAKFIAGIPFLKPILDIGCSDGIFGTVLFQDKKGAIEVGVDIDKIALKYAQNRRVYKKIIEADARKLPFDDQIFATVFSNQSLEHMENLAEVLKEINRVLKSKGKLIILVPTIFLDDYWLSSAPFKYLGLNNIAAFFHNLRNKVFRHINMLPQEVWQKKLEKAGFNFLECKYVGSKNVYFISELLWPIRVVQLLLSKALNKPILLPRSLVFYLVKVLEPLILQKNHSDLDYGPTMVIIAQKTI